MFKKFIKTGIVAMVFLIILIAANLASASFLNNNLRTNIENSALNVGQGAGYESGFDDSALILVQTVINVFLSIIGVLLLVYILYAGYNWLTAQGDEEKVTKAKDTIQRAILGAIIIIAAYAISIFVISRIEQGVLHDAGTDPVGTVR